MRPVRALTGLACLVVLVVSPVLALAAANPDSGRVVGGVRVTDEGIEILDEGASPKPVREPEDKSSGGNVVHIGPGGVKIEVGDEDGGLVRVDGPVIVVDSDDTGIVRVFSDAVVPADRHVEGDVVAVFGSAEVEGEVDGSVVAVFGSVVLGPKASVFGDAVAVGGVLDMAPGATVNGESVSVGFLPISWGVPTLPILLLTIAIGVLISLFVGWMLFLAFPERMHRTALTVSQRTGGSLLLGLIAPPLVIITIGLLFITVIGIPGAFLLPVLYGILLWSGHLAASYVLGCKLTRRAPGEGNALVPLIAGLAFVAMFFVVGALLASPPGFVRTVALFFSLLGVLLMVALSAIGSGALLLSRLGRRPQDGPGEAPAVGPKAPSPLSPGGPAARPTGQAPDPAPSPGAATPPASP